jgi:quinol-cytochrome oxidoreductase complex cytochrome b subunit
VAASKVGPWPRASAIALGVVVLVQLAVGLYLNFLYTPSASQAHETVQAIRDDPAGSILQNVHYWGSAWLIVHGFLHLLSLILSGAYLSLSRGAWIGSALVFGSAFAMQVTGNLLPFDRHDVQTAVIEGGVASQIPVLGDFASSSMLGAKGFGPSTVEIWHRAHLWLTVPLVIGGMLCLLAFKRSEPNKDGILRFLWIGSLVAITALSLMLPAPFGQAATSADYSSFDAKPSWYTWGMHGALNTFERLSNGLGWVGSAVLPGLFALLLMLAPWLGQRRDKLVRGAFLTFVIGFTLMAVFSGGRPAPAWGEQEVPVEEAISNAAATPIDEAKAAQGFAVAKRECSSCHGSDLKGKFGPNLVKTLPHREAQWYMEFIVDPKKKGSNMPPYRKLTEKELTQVAEWLRKPK